LNSSVNQLIVEQQRIVGVQVNHQGKVKRIKAKRGVMLAAGGFAHNEKLRQQHHPKPTGVEWTAANPGDTGDGILLAEGQGAALELMDCAWWTPALKYPDGRAEAWIVGKSMPGCMLVNQQGQRFVNDAAPYEDVVKAQYQHGQDAVPSYMICDARYRREYPIGLQIRPAKTMPDERVPEQLWKSGFIVKADSLAGLAHKLGMPANALQETVARYNRFAATGKDQDFGRGDSLTDRYYSDPRISPNPCLAPLSEGPFYAVKVYPGDLGTKGGVRCDEYARALNAEGEPIPGLYAAGNTAASVFGNSYPGAGATIGPAMTFAYIAAKHAAKD
jgi:3-oxosteroid 1-dehydrogenase